LANQRWVNARLLAAMTFGTRAEVFELFRRLKHNSVMRTHLPLCCRLLISTLNPEANRIWRPVIFLLGSVIAGADARMMTGQEVAVSEPSPHWIWSTPNDPAAANKTDRVHFARSFSVESGFQAAKLRLAADFCSARVRINGIAVCEIAPYSQTVTLDVTDKLQAGENQVLIETTGIPGPAGLALSLKVQEQTGVMRHIVTDSSWRIANDETATLQDRGPVKPELWGIGQRSIELSPFENYEQWRQASAPSTESDKPTDPQGLAQGFVRAKKFWLAPEFRIHLIRTARADEGSWVSMAFDPKGRLTIAREDKGLLRMSLDDERQSVTQVETINSELLECRGLLYAHDSLYVNANNSKAMFRLQDLDGNDSLKCVTLLREFAGGVGHGRNDLALGPDGLIYSIHGDSVQPPAPPLIDLTSPLRDSRLIKPGQEGYLVRTDASGESWELVCTGLRNPFGIDFNSAGDVFTWDADNEYDMGAPWYRATRLWQLNPGADFGWRVTQGSWPPHFLDRPDHGVAVLEVGKGSPTSVMFGTTCHFPQKYRNALFVLDWAYGRILAVHMAPRGTTYRCESELFLQGKPLNVTDLATGPDGDLYLITGGRKTQSSLYRVTSTLTDAEIAQHDAHHPGRTSQHETANAEYSQSQRGIRDALNEFLRMPVNEDPQSQIETALATLSQADPHLKTAARVVIEQLPAQHWQDLAMEYSPASDFEMLALSLIRLNNPELASRVLDRMLNSTAADESDSQHFVDLRQIAIRLHVYSQAASRFPDIFDEHRTRIISQVMTDWSQLQLAPVCHSPGEKSIDLNRRIAVILGAWGAGEVLEPGLSLLNSPIQEDQLAGLLALKDLKEGWTIEQRQQYFDVLNHSAEFTGGDGMPVFLKHLRTDAPASLSDAEQSTLGSRLEEPPADEEPIVPARAFVKRWTMEDLSPLLADGAEPGDPHKGAAIFRDALCARCHRAGLRGPAVGPDLTYVSRRFSRIDLCESILNPSRVVAENYRLTQVVTASGKTVTGRVLSDGDFRSETVRISTDSLRPNAIEVVDKRQIDSIRLLDTSPMPQGLLDTMTLDDIRNLVAYLEGAR
jgi:putative heme-binding domain-containing protein